jgi:carboxymethylenebutenolidase
MTQTATMAEIPVADAGRCDAYVASAPQGRAPAVVLIPPIFGTTPGIQEFAQNLAGQGFTVVVPDLFWRILPGPLGYEGADRDKAQDRYKRFDVANGIADLREIIGWCRGKASNGKVGVVGLCFGGRYAVLAAADLGADAAVSYHGTFIGRHLDALPRIKCPTGLHFGEADPHAPMTEVAQIADAGKGNPNIEVVTYPDAPHGFMQQDRPSFRPQAAQPAWAAGLSTLKKGLA